MVRLPRMVILLFLLILRSVTLSTAGEDNENKEELLQKITDILEKIEALLARLLELITPTTDTGDTPVNTTMASAEPPDEDKNTTTKVDVFINATLETPMATILPNLSTESDNSTAIEDKWNSTSSNETSEEDNGSGMPSSVSTPTNNTTINSNATVINESVNVNNVSEKVTTESTTVLKDSGDISTVVSERPVTTTARSTTISNNTTNMSQDGFSEKPMTNTTEESPKTSNGHSSGGEKSEEYEFPDENTNAAEDATDPEGDTDKEANTLAREPNNKPERLNNSKENDSNGAIEIEQGFLSTTSGVNNDGSQQSSELRNQKLRESPRDDKNRTLESFSNNENKTEPKNQASVSEELDKSVEESKENVNSDDGESDNEESDEGETDNTKGKKGDETESESEEEDESIEDRNKKDSKKDTKTTKSNEDNKTADTSESEEQSNENEKDEKKSDGNASKAAENKAAEDEDDSNEEDNASKNASDHEEESNENADEDEDDDDADESSNDDKSHDKGNSKVGKSNDKGNGKVGKSSKKNRRSIDEHKGICKTGVFVDGMDLCQRIDDVLKRADEDMQQVASGNITERQLQALQEHYHTLDKIIIEIEKDPKIINSINRSLIASRVENTDLNVKFTKALIVANELYVEQLPILVIAISTAGGAIVLALFFLLCYCCIRLANIRSKKRKHNMEAEVVPKGSRKISSLDRYNHSFSLRDTMPVGGPFSPPSGLAACRAIPRPRSTLEAFDLNGRIPYDTYSLPRDSRYLKKFNGPHDSGYVGDRKSFSDYGSAPRSSGDIDQGYNGKGRFSKRSFTDVSEKEDPYSLERRGDSAQRFKGGKLRRFDP